MLGAQGALIGTRFLATPEANILPEHRQHLLTASEEDRFPVATGSEKSAP